MESISAAIPLFGSTYAFHGSSIENWHSIMRQGLVNASGTKLQVNGAAYGAGIYLSPQSNVSFGYARIGHYGQQSTTPKDNNTAQRNGLQFLKSHNLRCIALCEVINSPCLRKSGWVWVAPTAEYVCTRFFFIYEDGQTGDHTIDTQNQDTYNKILKVVNSRHLATKT